MSCGRTKAETLVREVLAPKAVRDVINVLLPVVPGQKPLPFCIQTDASNKGNRKMFPIAVQYFTPEDGVNHKIIDFVENPDETAEGIVSCIVQSLEKLGLSLNQVLAFSADNTNVNYGIHKSVYTKLCNIQKDLLPGNCHAHIVHNTVKHALDKLSIDVENVVLKIYSFFSSSAKRRESLEEFCEFCDVEFREMLRHVTTRWLSLNPAVSRILQSWTALKSYFISLGEECPKQIRAALKLPSDAEEVNAEESDVVQVYLLFCNNILSIFEEVVKKLERNDTTVIELYPIMKEFRDKLVQRRKDRFYGYPTKVRLEQISVSEANTAKADFQAFLSTATTYIEKWFDFSDGNWLSSLYPFSLKAEIVFSDVQEVIEKLNMISRLNINMDELYDELTVINAAVERQRKESDWKFKDSVTKWMVLFQTCDLPNMLSVMSYVLSVPSSTGYVERIFSIMQSKWSETRNRCSIELIKSELMVTLNFEEM